MLFLFNFLLALKLSVLPVPGVSDVILNSTQGSSYLDLTGYQELELKPVIVEEVKITKEETTVPKKVVVKSAKAFVSPTPIGPAELETLWDKYSQEYGVNKEIMRKIAHCESQFNSGAVNGSYAGMYQFSASTWVANRRAMGLDPNPNLRFNAEESIKTTAYKISHDGTGAWPVCGKTMLSLGDG